MHVKRNHVFNPFQFVFSLHGDLINAIGRQQVTRLCLLSFCAAFGTIEVMLQKSKNVIKLIRLNNLAAGSRRTRRLRPSLLSVYIPVPVSRYKSLTSSHTGKHWA